MLAAVLHGKAGRISIDGEDQSWREVFRQREDLLTATIFGRFPYLSEQGERDFLNIFLPKEHVDELGDYQETIFWSKLKGIKERRHVEPDVIISYENALILIEVKPPFAGQQNPDQWSNEITALLKDDEWDKPEKIYFISLGGNSKINQSILQEVEQEYADEEILISLKSLSWETLQHGIAILHDNTTSRDSRVYIDWLSSLALFGLTERPRPFSDMLKMAKQAKLNISNMQSTSLSIKKAEDKQVDNCFYPLFKAAIQSKLRIDLWRK